jgi:hypothetical protein
MLILGHKLIKTVENGARSAASYRQIALAKAASLGCGHFTGIFLRFGRHSQLFL